MAMPRSDADTLKALETALLKIDAITRVETDPKDRSITYFRRSEGAEVAAGKSFIDNLHPRLQNAETDTERQAILDNFVATIQGMFDSPTTLSKARILPVIRHASFATNTDAMQLVSRPFLADMRVFYVQDLPTHLAYLNDTDLKTLGLTPVDLHKLAVQNATKMQWHPRIEGNGIFLPILDGTFESSLLLVPEFWSHLDVELGTIGAIIAARDVVIFTDIETPGMLQKMEDLTAKNQDNMQYPISRAPIKWNGRSWETIR